MESFACIKGVTSHMDTAHHDIEDALKEIRREKRLNAAEQRIMDANQAAHDRHHPDCTADACRQAFSSRPGEQLALN